MWSREHTLKVGICNTFDQLAMAGGGIAIIVSTGPGRGARESAWQIMHVNAAGQSLVTDPEAAWYNYKKMTFYFGRDKAAKLEEAKQWVARVYGEHGPWKRNRMRDYIPERIFKEFPLRKEK